VAIGWLVVLSTFGGYGSYLFVVRRSGATRASTLLYLTPPTTTLWSWLLLRQTPGPLAGLGIAICAIGVALAVGGSRHNRRLEGTPLPPSPAH
jgi:drug/metabolite transporter (DMT)-like permease